MGVKRKVILGGGEMYFLPLGSVFPEGGAMDFLQIV